MSRYRHFQSEHSPIFDLDAHGVPQPGGVAFDYGDNRHETTYFFMFDQARPVIDGCRFSVNFVQSIEYTNWGTWTGGRPKHFGAMEDPKAPRSLFRPAQMIMQETRDDRDLYEVVVMLSNGVVVVIDRECARDYAHRLTVALNLALARARDMMGQRKVHVVSPASRTPEQAIMPQRRIID